MTERTAARPPLRPVPSTAPVLRLREPRDLLAYLPHQIGFRPRESLVAVSLRSRGGELGLVVRVDLADLVGRSGAGLARTLVEHLRADRAATIQVVLYTGTDPRRRGAGGTLLPGDGPAVRAERRLRRAWGPTGVGCTWVVTAQGYLGLECEDPGCCPPGGRPLRDLDETAVAARMTARGSCVLSGREQLGQIEPAGSKARRSASEARLRWSDARTRAWAVDEDVDDEEDDAQGCADDPACRRAGNRSAGDVHRAGTDHRGRESVAGAVPVPVGVEGAAGTEPGDEDPGPAAPGPAAPGPAAPGPETPVDEEAPVDEGAQDVPAVVRWRRASLAVWHRVVDGVDGPPVPRDLGRLEAALHDRVVRDAVLLTVVAPGSPLARRMVSTDERRHDPAGGGVRIGDALAPLLVVDRAEAPDPAVTAAARAALERVVAHGRRGRQAPAFTLLAVLAWWQGDGARAAVLVQRARDHDPAYRLARIVERLVASGLPPAWVRRGC